MQKKQGGFTLLELLVVVAILAAIAGTATIMLQDTDRKGAAAAHVAMMDELSKGIQTFRVLNAGQYPNNFDSLLHNATNVLVGATDAGVISSDLAANLTLGTIGAGYVTALSEVGINTARVIDVAAIPPDATAGDCATGTTIKALLVSKKTNVTPQNIFRPATANGCGYAADAPIVATGAAYVWGDGTATNLANQRVNAPVDAKLIAFGVGPDSSLFNPATIGALSNVPVYRHVANTEYNRFIVLWNVGTTAVPAGQATFQAIIDGAGDTKDEELGEVDNVRKT
jgi:prepilin-type N-terminal cleavage/methylation domain-containing protein